MTYQFALSPDVNVRDLSHWFVFNTRLQKLTGEAFHLTAFDDFAALHLAIEKGEIDLVFANAADTALLIRQRGFRPLASPNGAADESLIAVSEESPVHCLADLGAGPIDVAAANAPDVERICRILLEPVDLGRDRIRLLYKRNPVLVAKAVLAGEVRAGFFLAAAYTELSESTRKGLRPIATSRIYVVKHSLLCGPRLAPLRDSLLAALARVSATEEDQPMLAGLGAPQGWSAMSDDEAEFMIDLMDTLEA
ncbi:MAG: PhnD/SsuA/transferrin family substrate-binding protein [Thermoanaerobaculia bacterium]